MGESNPHHTICANAAVVWLITTRTAVNRVIITASIFSAADQTRAYHHDIEGIGETILRIEASIVSSHYSKNIANLQQLKGMC